MGKSISILGPGSAALRAVFLFLEKGPGNQPEADGVLFENLPIQRPVQDWSPPDFETRGPGLEWVPVDVVPTQKPDGIRGWIGSGRGRFLRNLTGFRAGVRPVLEWVSVEVVAP